MLNELTPEQEAVLEQVCEAAYYRIGPAELDMPVVQAWVEFVYKELYSTPVPPIEVAQSPLAAMARATELTGAKVSSLDDSVSSTIDWVSRHEFYRQIGVVSDVETSENSLLLAAQTSIWDTLLLDELAIVVAKPIRLERDQEGNLHSATGPCLEWGDGGKEYAWHGVWVDERVILDPRSYTREEYVAITDTEQRRALGEAAGWSHIMALLGAELVDSWIHSATGLFYELFSSGSEKWLRKQSPALLDGSAPAYAEPVHEDLKTAAGARKWQACALSAGECDRDPALEYGQES